MIVPRAAAERLPRVVVVLGVVSLLTDVHSEMILAVLPVFVAETLAGGAAAVGIVEGVAELVASGARILSGRRSDASGRRKPLIVLGYAVSTVAKAAWPFVPHAAAAAGVRAVDRVGKGIRSAPRDALVADSVPPERRGAAFGFHRMLDTAGAVLGTLLAFLLLRASVGTRELMAWAAIPGALALLVLVTGVKERPARPTSPARKPGPPGGAAIRLGWFLGAEAVFRVAQVSYAFFLLRARDVGVEVALLPLLYLGYNVVYALAPYPLGRIADRHGRLRVLAAGYVLFAAATACAGLARGLDTPLVLSFALFGLASASVESIPRAVVAEALGPARRGTALAVRDVVQGFGGVACGLLFGLLWEPVGSGTLLLTAALPALLAASLLPLARAGVPNR